MKTIQEIAQWVIDNRYPKSENNKVSDAEMYHTLIEAMNQALRKHAVSGSLPCGCLKCYPNVFPNLRFNVCPICGNKRCPHASDHNYECTNSNDVGQIGSVYGVNDR
jgi:hypothetical protein